VTRNLPNRHGMPNQSGKARRGSPAKRSFVVARERPRPKQKNIPSKANPTERRSKKKIQTGGLGGRKDYGAIGKRERKPKYQGVFNLKKAANEKGVVGN